MKLGKRIFLFLALNFLVVITISILLNILGVKPYLTSKGLDVTSLALFCFIWGIVGAFISLLLSRVMAKWMMKMRIVNSSATNSDERALCEMVYALAKKAGLPANPEVGIFDSPELNAFATGPSAKKALVAVSSALLHKMPKAQLEAVLGHEIAHIANGDMVTMTLLQGVVNAFVMFLSRVIAYALSMIGRKDSEGPSLATFYLTSMVFQVVFMILGSFLIAWYSRKREYSADKGGAFLAGKEKMIEALKTLDASKTIIDPQHDKPALQAFKIHVPKRSTFASLLATHPTIADRIAKLQQQ